MVSCGFLRRVEKRDSAPILTAHPDFGILCLMRTLLQDGPRAHMPTQPEKRLLISLSGFWDRSENMAHWIGFDCLGIGLEEISRLIRSGLSFLVVAGGR